MNHAIERWYSTLIYPAIQAVMTTASNAVPLALLDVLAIAAVVVLAALWWRAIRQPAPRWPAIRRAAVITAVASLCVYLAFLLLWGLNYQRLGLEAKLVLDRAVPSTDDVVRLAQDAVVRLNELHARAHAEGWQEPVWTHAPLLESSRRVQRMLGADRTAVPGRLKQTLFGTFFRWTGTDGMVNPFGLEVLGNPDLLSFERPFVIAHEWAHLAGYAEESEANFVGWLTCLGADVPSQYSGWLYLYWQIVGELPGDRRGDVDKEISGGPRKDLDAIVARLQRGDWPLLRRASWAAYDKYLKANAVESGVRSYGEVVTLILRARFEDGWRPVPRADRSRGR